MQNPQFSHQKIAKTLGKIGKIGKTQENTGKLMQNPQFSDQKIAKTLGNIGKNRKNTGKLIQNPQFSHQKYTRENREKKENIGTVIQTQQFFKADAINQKHKGK